LLDCIVIGGGPAGLAAATYLARFRRSVSVLDAGKSRAMLIPCTNNLPGFPDGISGKELLSRLENHAARFTVPIDRLTVTAVGCGDEGFAVEAGEKTVHARAVLLATGVADRRPPIPNLDQLIRRGLVRLCPVCDAHEMIGGRIGVLGPAERAAREACFLSTYTKRVTVLTTDPLGHGTDSLLEQVQSLGIACVQADIQGLDPCEAGLIAILNDRSRLHLDALYLAFGADPASLFGVQLGAKVTASGCILVDRHQRTSVAGLYAAGDVVDQLDQIAVAFGHAAIAATAIHNDLRNGAHGLSARPSVRNPRP
jgi:thioredoxin reductase (NADPH)